jgi:hypothetical protein
VDTKLLRSKYFPSEVRVLFVGESPPAGGTFFYASNSNLYFATAEAFRAALPSRGIDFLDEFQRFGCYLDDLCLQPVNHLDSRDPVRLAARADGELRLAEQIRMWRPRAIIVVMVAIADNVARAREQAGLPSVPFHVLPFPGRKAHRDRYVAELTAIASQLAKSGVIRD